MNILGLIPARGGSKGVPGKNLKMLGGKPLLLYTAEAALNSRLLGSVILSTDDEQIADFGSRCGLEVPFLRPRDLALDDTPTLPVVQHALRFLGDQKRIYDAVCLLQPTYPFRSKDLIDRAIQEFITQDTDSLVSVLRVPHQFNPHWVFEKNHNGRLRISTGDNQIISRRQDLPVVYYRDGAVYLTKSLVLLEGDSLYGNEIGFIESDPQRYVNIDSETDWMRAEQIWEVMSSHRNK